MKKSLRWLARYWMFLVWLFPLVGAAAGLVPCGQASDLLTATNCNLCSFAELIRNIVNFLMMLSVPIVALLFCVAGWDFFTAGGNTSKIEHGKRIFSSALIGFIIAIASWLIIQTIIIGLVTNQSFYSGIGNSWNTLDCGGDIDSQRHRQDSIGALLGVGGGSTAQPVWTGPGGGGANTTGTRGKTVCVTGNCNPQSITEASNAAGMSLPGSQVNALSCIAQTENSGQAAGCSATTACGTFQINQGNWNAYAPANCQGLQNRNNAQCNLQTALVLYQKEGYQPWTGHDSTGKQWNPAASTCVNTFDPGTSVRTS